MFQHTLYLYAKLNSEDFLRSHFDNEEVQEAIEKLRYCATVERRRDKNVCIVPDADDNQADIMVKTTRNILYWISTDNQASLVTEIFCSKRPVTSNQGVPHFNSSGKPLCGFVKLGCFVGGFGLAVVAELRRQYFGTATDTAIYI